MKKLAYFMLLVIGFILPLSAVTVSADSNSLDDYQQFFDSQDSSNSDSVTFSSSSENTQVYTIPKNTPIPLEGIRWPSKRVKIYLAAHDNKIKLAFKDAVRQWNQTKAIHFVWVHHQSQAQVIAQDGDLAHDNGTSNGVGVVTSQLGSTQTEYNPDTHALMRATSTLDANQLSIDSRQFRCKVAEHELGHAIGLAHAPEYAHSVMVPRNVKTGITKEDIKSVRELYR